jgi:hypothetical protein
MIKQLEYPVIFNKGSMIEPYPDEDYLTKSTRTALRKGLYTNSKIIDAKGREYKILSAEKIGRAKGPLLGLDNLLLTFLVFPIRLKLNFSNKVTQLSLEEFKEKIIKAYNSDKYFWDSGGNLKKYIQIVKDSKTYKEIIEKFSEEFYRKYKT